MMENRFEFDDLSNEHFKFLLENCYFHSSRKYVSEEVKFIAKEAMNFLWNMNEISVKGIHFEAREIRERMIYQMSCEDLDRAIGEAISLKWKIKFTDFITLIFEHILFGDRIVEIQIEKTRNGNVA